MPSQSRKLNRQQFPAGRDGQQLVLETHSPNGIAWRNRPEAQTDSYLSAHRSVTGAAVGYGGMASAGEYWKTDADVVSGSAPTWTRDARSSDWSDSSNGEFEYTGTGTRFFLASWHMSAWYYAGANVYTSLMGGIFKYDGSWGAAPVSPSGVATGFYGNYPYFNNYYTATVSGSCVVEMAQNEKLRHQVGFKIWLGTNTGGFAGIHQAGGTDLAGMSITITPVT